MSVNGNFIPAAAAWHHVMSLLTAALLMAGCWCRFRLPHGELALVAFCFLSASVLYNLPRARDRFRLLVMMAGFTVLLQFWIGICRGERILLILLPSLTAAMIFSVLPHTAAWPVCIAGFLGFSSPPGFLPTMDSALAIAVFGIPSVWIATILFHTPRPEPPDFYEKLDGGTAFGLAFLLGFGIWIAEALRMPQGMWIMLTILFIGQFAGSGDWAAASFERISATPLGLILGGVYMGCFTGFDYRFAYLLIPLGVLAFYQLYRTGSFFLFTVWFMTAFSIYADWSTGDCRRFHFAELLFWRSAATLIGAGLLFVFRGFFRKGRAAA